uniref:Uncharacterized protein n=1 Tax=Anguilla anguilla TaxID=7936 RepID=A0A0E9XFL0_ANGAN
MIVLNTKRKCYYFPVYKFFLK